MADEPAFADTEIVVADDGSTVDVETPALTERIVSTTCSASL